jgi:hypothetical protein
LLSTCATLDAPGIATTCGWCTVHASAICAGVTSCAAATSRSTDSSGPAARRFSGRNIAFAARTRFVGRLSASYRPDSSPWASGL